MHVLQRLFFGNYILSVALLSWLAAQICKTIINYILSGKLKRSACGEQAACPVHTRRSSVP